MASNTSGFTKILQFAIVLALIVIVLGAYARLTDSGLGCPDWPGCYGQIAVPKEVSSTEYERPLEIGKAWKEMIHRYVAGSLGLLILVILYMSIKGREKNQQSPVLPIVLTITVVFQALLGMWTVTLKLSPIVVTAHLIGGFTTLSLIWWLLLNQKSLNLSAPRLPKILKPMTFFALVVVILQIILGGWVSTNYAALACGTDFPTCMKSWMPAMDFANGFDITHETGMDYEFGVLESPARAAIQYTHRVGALIVLLYLSLFGFVLLKKGAKAKDAVIKRWALIMYGVLSVQIILGILNVVLGLPISVAVLHNLVAALLLLTILAISHRVLKAG